MSFLDGYNYYAKQDIKVLSDRNLPLIHYSIRIPDKLIEGFEIRDRLVQVNWLHHVGIGLALVTSFNILLMIGTAENNNRHIGAAILC